MKTAPIAGLSHNLDSEDKMIPLYFHKARREKFNGSLNRLELGNISVDIGMRAENSSVG